LFRGDDPDFGSFKAMGMTQTDAAVFKPHQVKDPSWEDMLIANATVSGFVANRFVTR
jgi:hypothetical protein